MQTWRVQCPQFAWEHTPLCHWNKAKYSNQPFQKLPTYYLLCCLTHLFSLPCTHDHMCPFPPEYNRLSKVNHSIKRRAHLAALKLNKFNQKFDWKFNQTKEVVTLQPSNSKRFSTFSLAWADLFLNSKSIFRRFWHNLFHQLPPSLLFVPNWVNIWKM